MVTTKIYGRLGNNIFQICNAIAYAKRNSLQWHIPKGVHPFEGLGNPSFISSLPKKLITEQQHNFYDLPFDEQWNNLNIEFNGYWQSELRFKDFWDEIRPLFKVNWEPLKDKVSLHVRRGDYLTYADKHPPVMQSYLEPAMKHFAEEGFINFLCFSDDIEWVLENINHKKYPNYNFEYSFIKDPVDDLGLMSSCHAGHIISNSTFSWWGAYFNQNENKIVVSPSKQNWFGEGNKNISAETIIPDSWVQIKY